MGMIIRDVCPRCQSPKYKKNGHIQNGKQNHQCKDCGRQFVDGFEQYRVRMKRVISLSACCWNASHFAAYAVQPRSDSNGYWALWSPVSRLSLTI